MIEKLFTSKTRTKMLELMLFNRREFSMREIERKLKIPVSAVKREIDNLIELSIVKKANGRYMVDDNCSFLASLTDIFIKTDSIRFLFQQKFVHKDIISVFIFGSFANNSFTNESDVDLFIVGNVSLKDVVRLIRPIERKIGREINPVVWSFEKLKKEKNKSFVKDVAKNNVLMIKGNEDELRKIIGRRKD